MRLRPAHPVKCGGGCAQGVQDADRPPTSRRSPSQPERRARVETQALRGVLLPERVHWISAHRDGRRHLGQGPAVRPSELERPVGRPRDLVALLVHRAVVPPAEQREVRERRRAALRPVLEMMPLSEPHPAPREAAAVIPVLESPPQRGGIVRVRAPTSTTRPPHRGASPPARVARQAPDVSAEACVPSSSADCPAAESASAGASTGTTT